FWPDNDDAGRALTGCTAGQLAGKATVYHLQVPGLPKGGDAVDFVRAGRTAEELRELMAGAKGGDERAETAESAGEWAPPLPFHEVDRPPFPTDQLSPWMAAWVEAEATATQTPPDLAAALALCSAAAAVARKVELRVRPGYTEPLNI